MFKSRKEKKITLATGIGFGLTDVMGGSSGAIIGAYLMFFYTTFAGLTAVQAASIFAVSKIIDSVTGVVMGNITDSFYRTKLGKKFGRRRFFLLIGAPLMLCYGLIWVNGFNYWYYFFTFILFDILASVVLIPFETLPSEMTTDFSKRTLMSTCRMTCSGFASAVCTMIGGWLISIMGDKNPKAYLFLGVIFSIIYVICVLITYFSTWERELTPEMINEANKEKSSEHLSFGEICVKLVDIIKNYFSTLRVKAFRQHLIMYLFGVTAMDTIGTIFVYFIVFDMGSSASVASNLLSISFLGVPLGILWGLLFVKIGPANLLKFAYTTVLVSIVGYYFIYIVHPKNGSLMIALIIASAVFQIGKSLVYFTPWNVFPFIPDVDEIITGKRREGLFAAVMTFLRKSTSGISSIIVGLFLDKAGLVKGATTQTVVVQNAIAYILLFGAGGLTIVALIFAFRFKLNTKTHSVLINEIKRLKNNGSKEDVNAETKMVVESLTGVRYEKLWPIANNSSSVDDNILNQEAR